MRTDYQIVAVHDEIADRGGGHVEAQGLPIVAIVEADEDGELGGGEEEAFAQRVFADCIDGSIGQAANGFLPGGAAIVGAIDVGLEIVEAEAIDGGVDGVVIEVRGVELGHLAPGSDGGRGDVFPGLAAVAREVDEAIVGARPEDVDVEARGGEGVDDAAARGLLFGSVGVGRDAGGSFVGFAAEIGADGFPVAAAIGGLEDHLRAEVEDVRIDVAEKERRGAQVAIGCRAVRRFRLRR